VDFHINGGFLQQFVSSVDSLGPRCIDRSAVVMPQERVEAVGARMIAAVGVKDLGQWGRYVRKTFWEEPNLGEFEFAHGNNCET